VREALRILERDGLVQIHVHRGAPVTQLNVDEVNDLFEERISLLGLAARLAAERGDPQFMARLREGVGGLSGIVKQGNADAYTGAVYRNNLMLAEGSGNRFLRNTVFALAHLNAALFTVRPFDAEAARTVGEDSIRLTIDSQTRANLITAPAVQIVGAKRLMAVSRTSSISLEVRVPEATSSA
jgi:DNA-binding GntR family transcriptional regulator